MMSSAREPNFSSTSSTVPSLDALSSSGIRFALPKLADHALEVELVKARGDGAPPLGPGDGVGGDEALAHDVLEHEGQRALVVVLRVLAQDVPGDHRVVHNHERLWAKAHLVDRPVPVKVRLQREEDRLEVEALDVRRRERRLVRSWDVAEDLLDVDLEGARHVASAERLTHVASLQKRHRVPEPIPDRWQR